MILKINKAMKKINTDCNHAELIYKLSVKTGFNQKLIAELLEETVPCVSLDDAANGDVGESKLSILPDTLSYTPEETAIYHWQKQYLYENLGKLDAREKQIICMLYGLKPYKRPYSLAEIGKMFGETMQNIHYIKQRTMEKLKNIMKGLAT